MLQCLNHSLAQSPDSSLAQFCQQRFRFLQALCIKPLRSPYEVCEYPEEGTVFVEALNKTVPNEEVRGTREAVEAWYKAGQEVKK